MSEFPYRNLMNVLIAVVLITMVEILVAAIYGHDYDLIIIEPVMAVLGVILVLMRDVVE